MTKRNLFLLSCCGPCSVEVIERLSRQEEQFTVVFYNPNIRPQAEYEKRRDENKRICDERGVPFVELPYDPQSWDEAVRGLEMEPERGKRCSVCFKLRLLRTARFAKEHGGTIFSSVLGVSRHKDFEQVCRAGFEAAQETGLPYDDTNWRKNGGEVRRQQLVKLEELYTQAYCGCKPRKS